MVTYIYNNVYTILVSIDFGRWCVRSYCDYKITPFSDNNNLFSLFF